MSKFTSEVTSSEKTGEYPRLMISVTSESVFMMTSPICGMKLVQGKSPIGSNIAVGTFLTDWVGVHFVPFYGGIKMSARE